MWPESSLPAKEVVAYVTWFKSTYSTGSHRCDLVQVYLVNDNLLKHKFTLLSPQGEKVVRHWLYMRVHKNETFLMCRTVGKSSVSVPFNSESSAPGTGSTSFLITSTQAVFHLGTQMAPENKIISDHKYENHWIDSFLILIERQDRTVKKVSERVRKRVTVWEKVIVRGRERQRKIEECVIDR